MGRQVLQFPIAVDLFTRPAQHSVLYFCCLSPPGVVLGCSYLMINTTHFCGGHFFYVTFVATDHSISATCPCGRDAISVAATIPVVYEHKWCINWFVVQLI